MSFKLRSVLLGLGLSSLLTVPSMAHDKSKIPYFPKKDHWETIERKTLDWNHERFDELIDYTFSEGKYKDEIHKTDGLLILKDGKIVYERYKNGYNQTSRHMLWSFSKSLANGIMGAAEYQGILKRDQKLIEYFPQLKEKEWGDELTLKHLMNMSSGFDFHEENPNSIVFSNSIYLQYAWRGYKDMAGYVLEKNLKFRPGTEFSYNTGDAVLSMALLKKVMEEKNLNYHQFPWDGLFHKIGAMNTTIERDALGVIHAGGFGWSNPRDIARFALLYERGGVWDTNEDGVIDEKTERIFSKDWVKFSTQVVPPSLTRSDLVEKERGRLNIEPYGAFWWLNDNSEMSWSSRLPYPNLPKNAYLALGYRGQTLTVLPDQKIIVVRLGSDGSVDGLGGKIDRHKFFGLMRETFKIGKALEVSEFELETEKDSIFGLIGDRFRSMNGRNDVDDSMAIATSKDTCSCIFVSKQKASSCLKNHPQYETLLKNGLINEPIIDYKNKTVTAEARLPFLHLVTTRVTSKHMNTQTGCLVTEMETPTIRDVDKVMVPCKSLENRKDIIELGREHGIVESGICTTKEAYKEYLKWQEWEEERERNMQ